MAYEGEKDPPWYAEEPVSPYDAARWSAMTYSTTIPSLHPPVSRNTPA
jgi:hypothetical protein